MQLKFRIGNFQLPETGLTLVSVFAVFLCLIIPAAAQENEDETLNRLYREIINSAPVGVSMGMDSVRQSASAGSTVESAAADTPRINLPAGTLVDPANEQLKNEIEKLLQEAQARHGGALKFMQESR